MTTVLEAVAQLTGDITVGGPLSEAIEERMANWLRKHVAVPTALYHYTNFDGLQGILGSQSIWATNANYLNDASELSYARSLIQIELAGVAARSGLQWFSELVDTQPGLADPFSSRPSLLVASNRVSPFIACFCENGDLLSQWRGYSKGQPAFAIGLDLARWQMGVTPRLRRVIYDSALQTKLARETIESWMLACDEEINSETSRDDLLSAWAVPILRRMLFEFHMCFKNPAFEEEREWRLIQPIDVLAMRILKSRRDEPHLRDWHDQLTAKLTKLAPRPAPPAPSGPQGTEYTEIMFRTGPFGVVPYVELNLSQSEFIKQVPLVRVTHGPTEHTELAMQALAECLSSMGYDGSARVLSPSSIPLRGS